MDASLLSHEIPIRLACFAGVFATMALWEAAGHDAMTIGIELFRTPRELRLDRMLLQPFRADGAGPGRVNRLRSPHA